MRFFSALVVLAASLRLDAAMVRVVAVEDARTITVEREGARESVRLAGVAITDDVRAREVLRWTALDAWVMLERAEGDAFLVYRSPDALLLNRELVLRGCARATLPSLQPDLRPPSRYLGEFNPPADSRQARSAASEAPRARPRSTTSRRPSASPSRRARPKPKARTGGGS